MKAGGGGKIQSKRRESSSKKHLWQRHDSVQLFRRVEQHDFPNAVLRLMLIHNPSSHQEKQNTHPGAVFRCRNVGKRLERVFLPSFLTIVGSRVDKMPISPLALSTERNWMCVSASKVEQRRPLRQVKELQRSSWRYFLKGH